MKWEDLNKDVRRLLLAQWTKKEIDERLSDPDYFFDHVVLPRLAYLRSHGEDIPDLRVHRTPSGEFRVYLAN